MSKFITIILLLLIPMCSYAKKNERYYQTIHCDELKGQKEYRLSDNTRVDCLTDYEAIEHDWAEKWAECVGQSLYYSIKTKKQPVCVLIGSKENLIKHSKKIEEIKKEYNLPLKVILIEK